MVKDFTKEQILKWADIIYNADNVMIEQISEKWTEFRKIFIEQIGKSLYEDMRRSRILITAPFTVNKEFRQLTYEEQKIWYNYAAAIPEKLKSLNLFIRPFNDFCRTCIITDDEIEKLAAIDHDQYFVGSSSSESVHKKQQETKRKINPKKVTYSEMPGARKWYFRELNYLIPPQLRKIGYEIIRTDEVSSIDAVTIKKLSRAIHSRYLQEIRKNSHIDETGQDVSVFIYPGDEGHQFITDYDNLPDDIKISNKDNAYHIPTKLLSIGYKIRHIQKGFKALTLHLDPDEIETMARVEHIRWSWDKRLNGWIYGNVKDNETRIHPGLISYEDLADSEKEKDRELVRLIPALLQDIEYEAYPVNPDLIKNLSYSIKPHSSIHKLLNETHLLNEEIKEMAASVPSINEKIRIINKKIDETISEVQGSYNYARHIQKTFLPDDLYIRECFPDSFVLFKPKDIVSGDFYFFSQIDHQIIFAAADCTGHGIPGALLSTIGYGITDQAVNELKISNPSDILNHLYSKVHRFLRWDEDETGLSDDMDIVLCSLDIRTNLLTFSSVRIPLYHIRNGEISEYFPKNFSTDYSANGNCQFLSENIQLKRGDTIYLCSDGYIDQFGGPSHKKYLKSRFKSYLKTIQEYTMPEQSDRLYEEIERWREEYDEDQTDDILVIGIRI
jgi:serine phosphatase RsbU (regulator of sigma subunit)